MQQTDGADDRREDAAALDVGDQHPRRVDRRVDQPQIHEIDVAQVQLADAAGALDDDHVEAAGQIARRPRARARAARRRARSTRAAAASSTRGR